MQAWFVSDIHIKDLNERSSVLLLRFLYFLRDNPKATHLFLLGDIFDLWVGDSEVFQRKFQDIVDALADLKRNGIEVFYFEGNHDVHVSEFWQKKLKIPVFTHEQIFTLGRFQVRMEHGDYINPDDKAYMNYLKIIRHEKAEKLAYLLPGHLLNEAGKLASKLSRKKSSQRRQNNIERLRDLIRAYAEKSSKHSEFDYIITGHMHVRDEYRLESNRQKISINLGSWYEEPMALCLENTGHYWKSLI